MPIYFPLRRPCDSSMNRSMVQKILQRRHMPFRYHTAWMKSDIHIFSVCKFCRCHCHFHIASVPHVWIHSFTWYPAAELTTGNLYFSPTTIIDWNNPPEEVATAPTLKLFQSSLSHLKLKYFTFTIASTVTDSSSSMKVEKKKKKNMHTHPYINVYTLYLLPHKTLLFTSPVIPVGVATSSTLIMPVQCYLSI